MLVHFLHDSNKKKSSYTVCRIENTVVESIRESPFYANIKVTWVCVVPSMICFAAISWLDVDVFQSILTRFARFLLLKCLFL